MYINVEYYQLLFFLNSFSVADMKYARDDFIKMFLGKVYYNDIIR